jgi:hypothetical protein
MHWLVGEVRRLYCRHESGDETGFFGALHRLRSAAGIELFE